jgi:hypothetical protein
MNETATMAASATAIIDEKFFCPPVAPLRGR